MAGLPRAAFAALGAAQEADPRGSLVIDDEAEARGSHFGMPRRVGYELLQGAAVPRSVRNASLKSRFFLQPRSRWRLLGALAGVGVVLAVGCFALAACTGSVLQAWGSTFLQQAWNAGTCSAIGTNCTRTKCCQNKAFKCYYKDPGWAECKLACHPGVNYVEPKALQTPWSCEVAGVSTPTWPAPLKPVTPPAQTTAPVTTTSTTLRPTVPPPVSTASPTTVPPTVAPTPTAEATTQQPAFTVRAFKVHPAPTGAPAPQRVPRGQIVEIPPPPTTTAAPTVVTTLAPTTLVPTTLAPTTLAPTTSTAVPGPRPTLLCLSLMLSFGVEVSLIKSQLSKGVGIFQCNSWKVYSNVSVELSPGPPSRLTAEVFPGSLVCPISHKYPLPAAMNSEIFYRFWQKVLLDQQFQAHDWTVKLDPDAVLLPDRLRSHLEKRNPVVAQYINNCDEGLHGPIEAISRGGMDLFGRNMQKCHDSMVDKWMTFGEDVWLRKCFRMIGVLKQDDWGVLYERACRPYKWPMPCVSGAASFHPLKTPKDYFTCLDQARR